MDIPKDRFYTKTHEWALPEGDTVLVGITDFAQLPDNARSYLARLEQLAGVPIDIVSTGPDRAQTIVLRHPYD